MCVLVFYSCIPSQLQRHASAKSKYLQPVRVCVRYVSLSHCLGIYCPQLLNAGSYWPRPPIHVYTHILVPKPRYPTVCIGSPLLKQHLKHTHKTIRMGNNYVHLTHNDIYKDKKHVVVKQTTH